jgi:hypothetical protein
MLTKTTTSADTPAHLGNVRKQVVVTYRFLGITLYRKAVDIALVHTLGVTLLP